MSQSGGRKAFEERWEYPLKKEAGTRDYVFYFVGAGDPYGQHARDFIRLRYSEHDAQEVHSFEELFARVKHGIEQHNLTHVREIIIVAHAAARGLITPLVAGASETHLKQYKCVCARSLKELREEIATAFPSFAADRSAVIARMTERSWVTVRACNYGQSRANLRALYAFFGGRANVYAPRVYQFFGEIATGPERRFETKFDVHRHFLRQGYLRTHTHTPERADAVVNFMLEPGLVSEPIELFNVDFFPPPPDPPPAPPPPPTPEMVAFDTMTAALDDGVIPPLLRTRLQQVGVTLTKDRAFRVLARELRWRITDTIVHEGDEYDIEYDLYVEVRNERFWVMSVESRLTVPDASGILHEQLFVTEHEKKRLQGVLAQLGGYADPPHLDQNERDGFDAWLAVLNTLDSTPKPVPAEVREAFFAANVELPETARIRELQATTLAGRTWHLTSPAGQYHIMLENPRTDDGTPAHAITIFEHYKNEIALDSAVQATLADTDFGESPDRPGVELQSYLDTLPIETLAEIVDFLREPYSAENAVYLHHAVQAINRKHRREQWLATRPEYVADPAARAPLYELSFPHTRLTSAELSDLRLNAYEFVADNYWEEAKASKPPPPTFQNDLYLEHPFSFTTGELADCSDLVADSLSADVRRMRNHRSPALQWHMQRSKDMFVPNPTRSEALDCKTFRELIDLMKGLQGKSLEEVEAALNAFKPHPRPGWSMTDLDYKRYGIPKPIVKIHTIWKTFGGPFLPDDIITKALKWVKVTYDGTRLGRLAAFAAAAKSFSSLATLVAEMFIEYLSTYKDALLQWKNRGQLVAMRQWAEKVHAMTRRQSFTFPTSIHIDFGPNLQPLYEEEIGYPWTESLNVIMDMDIFREGFNRGHELIEREGNEILSHASRIIDAMLLSEDLTPCMIRELRDAGMIDPATERAMVMQEYTSAILEKLPKPRKD